MNWRRLGADMVGNVICDAYIEFLIQGELIELECQIEFSDPNDIEGCWLKWNNADLFNILTDEQMETARMWARQGIADLADRLEARDEDAAEAGYRRVGKYYQRARR